MDLGIADRVALVTASSQGLGLACARALAREGASVVINGRDPEKLSRVVRDLGTEFPGAKLSMIAADLTTRHGLDSIIDAVPEVDILVTNNAGPPPSGLEEWNEDALAGAFAANTVPAVQLMRAYLPGMRSRGFGRVINITSAMVTSPKYDMGLSAAARAALTGISKAISAEVAADNVTINNLLPERFDTQRQDIMAQRLMDGHGIDRAEATRRIASAIPARRLGRPEELGDACAFLAGAQAGYITAQNLRLDGGSYEGLI